MRIERWYWLVYFCIVSLAIHIGMVLKSQRFTLDPIPSKVTEIEVALLPLEPEQAKPVPKPEPPKPQPKPATKPAPSTREVQHDRKILEKALRTADNRPAQPVILKPIPQDREDTEKPVQPGGTDPLKEEKPLPLGLPTGVKDAGVPKLQRIARNEPVGGGGSPAPGLVLGGKGGAPGPEAPPEDIIFNGGGAGGTKLPKEAPRIGGGGGRSILSVENPLAKEAIPEEKPGLGPGLGGGQGLGQGGGVGVRRDRGIGTRLDGKEALATLRSKPGPGIGASAGRGIGTRPPGGGKGTGSELPGTGGTGVGYGRGSGIGVGNGSGAGVGDGASGRMGLTRGIPFGDIAGLLRGGDPNGGGGTGGGPGGPGRGAVFGAKPGGGGNGPVHIVYLLDVSGSMEFDRKIQKAKEALKKAVSELKPKDSFNIITFFGAIDAFAETMVPATKGNIDASTEFIDQVELGPGTDLFRALETALTLDEKVTHIFVLSDGEPNRGITRPSELRSRVKELNTKGIHIISLALGLGEEFRGMALLRGLAEDNDGTFSYINLTKVRE